jgi:E3 ubiquitin-protein ligase HUWE1
LPQSKELEQLFKKLTPLLECFLNVYKSLAEENEKVDNDKEFFERYLSGSGVSSAKREGPVHLQRTFSAVRDNQMQLEDQFLYICFKGKSVINVLLTKKLLDMQLEVRVPNNFSVLRAFH